MNNRKRYTDRQKAAYYKKMALSSGRAVNSNTRAPKRRRRARTVRRKNVDNTTGLVQSLGDIGGTIGSAFGPLGGLAGRAIGSLGGQALKFFTGRGAYQIKENALLNEGNPDMPPIMNTLKNDGAVRIRRSEYIGDVITSSVAGNFQNNSYYVNPGLGNTFQWLSQVAADFEEYEFEGIYFEFRSMSADALNSVNTALGQVILSAEYNAANSPFASKQEMENYEGGVSIKPSESVKFFLECAKDKTVLPSLYVRTGAVPPNQDQRLYDLANFQLATNGFQGTNVNVGELWVCYQVALRKPKLFEALGLGIGYNWSTSLGYGNAAPVGSASNWIQSTGNNLVLTFSQTSIQWPQTSIKQTYNVSMYWQGATSQVFTPPALSVTAGMTVTAKTNAPTSGENVTRCMMTILVVINGNTGSILPTLVFGTAGSLPTGTNRVDIWVNQIPNGATDG